MTELEGGYYPSRDVEELSAARKHIEKLEVVVEAAENFLHCESELGSMNWTEFGDLLDEALAALYKEENET